ncbi:hypothetical protein OC844_000104 [Tilletia horrida]|nr:hypothetical protein OC844_000104 [Tilletia horrida]
MALLLPAAFTPVHSFLGGLILSSAVSALLAQTGTVLGISGFFHATVFSVFVRGPRALLKQITSHASPASSSAQETETTGKDGGEAAVAALKQRSDETAQSTARYFTLGLLSSGVLLAAGRRAFEGKLGIQLFDDALSQGTLKVLHAHSHSPFLTLLLGVVLPGLLVGAGTKLGSGCTSGHFLCGLSRLSPRSFAATATFFSVAVLTNLAQPLAAFLPYHILKPSSAAGSPLNPPPTAAYQPSNPEPLLLLAFQIPALVYGLVVPYVIAGRAPTGREEDQDQGPEARAERERRHEQAARVTALSTGIHFGLGLALSGMLRPSKVTGFLNLSPSHFRAGTWDPSLAFVALGGILPASLAYFTRIVPKVNAQRRALAHLPQQQEQQGVSGPKVAGTEKAKAKATTTTGTKYGAIGGSSSTTSTTAHEATSSAPLLSAAAPLWRVPLSSWSSLSATRIDARLLLGASLFGLGWGLSGLCPGPVLVSLGANAVPAPVGVGAVGVGVGAADAWGGLETQPGTAGSFVATTVFTAAMALGGLLVQ